MASVDAVEPPDSCDMRMELAYDPYLVRNLAARERVPVAASCRKRPSLSSANWSKAYKSI